MTTREKFPVSWRRSSQCVGSTTCVEVAPSGSDTVGVRDAKDPHGPAFWFSSDQWQDFVKGVRSGEWEVTRVA